MGDKIIDITDSQRKALIMAAAEEHLLGWCCYTDPTFKMPKHIKLLAEHLMKVERGEIKRLMITMPPRNGKSLLTTIKFPTWFLGRNPDKRVIIAAYGDSLAWNFSRQSRNDFTNFGSEIFGLEIAKDSKAKNSWSIKNHLGGMVAAGVGSGLTGKGGDIILADDIFKDQKEANSKLIRDQKWEWYTSVARTRLHPGGAIIVINTRWSEDDLTGRILANDPDGWVTLNLPAIAEKDDVMGRKEGEALWPERFPLVDLEAIRKDVGDYVFSALYQQRPSPPSGSIIKKDWIRFWDEMPAKFDKIIQTWDLSTKVADGSSYVVGQVWGKIGTDRYLLDQFRSRVGFMDSIRAIKFMNNKWKEGETIFIEEKANGPAVIQVLRNEISGVVAVNPTSSKEDRFRATSPLFQGGNIFFPSPLIAPWVNDLVHEVVTFPFSANDDQVDCLTMAQDQFGKERAIDIALSMNTDQYIKDTPFNGYDYARSR